MFEGQEPWIYSRTSRAPSSTASDHSGSFSSAVGPRGGADEGSDVDLLVEMETDLRPADRTVQISSVFGLRRWPLDVVVVTPEEAARLRAIPTSFLSRIEAEGRVLYERP